MAEARRQAKRRKGKKQQDSLENC